LKIPVVPFSTLETNHAAISRTSINAVGTSGASGTSTAAARFDGHANRHG